MPQLRQDDTVPVFDLVGVGFGPSNLALAIAVHERADAAAPPVRALFLERQAAFGWHRGMLIEDATMQVSFLKDLVTMRDPTSSFSFLCYLHERGRLIDFVNHKSLFPLRVEFHDYLEWAALRVRHMVRYGQDVTAVRPVVTDGVVDAYDVESATPPAPAASCAPATSCSPAACAPRCRPASPRPSGSGTAATC